MDGTEYSGRIMKILLIVCSLMILLGTDALALEVGKGTVTPDKGSKSSLTLSEEELITKEELRQMQVENSKFTLFDARGKSSYDSGHIIGAILALPNEYYIQKELLEQGLLKQPMDYHQTLAKAMERYPKNADIVTYCNANCKASASFLKQLQALGFTNVRAMEEGYQAWDDAGYPVVRASQETPPASVP